MTDRDFAALLDDPEAFVGITDGDGRLVRTNERALGFLGPEEDDVRGLPLWETPWVERSTVSAETVRENTERALDGEFRRCGALLTGPNGGQLSLDVTYRPVTDDGGDVTRLLVEGRDVTEQRSREHTVRALHGATRDLMAAKTKTDVAETIVETALTVLDLPYTGVFLRNESTNRLESAANSDAATETLGPPPTFECGEGIVGSVFETGESATFDDVQAVEAGLDDGSSAIRSYCVLPLGDHGVVTVASPEPGEFDEVDVEVAKTLAANAEAALDRSERERELARKNERLEEFASIVSHELRNPLNIAAGNLELAIDGEKADHIRTARSALDRMATLIENVLTLARQERTVGEQSRVAPAEAFRSAWETVDPGGATLTVDAPEHRELLADDSQLAQLCANLFQNAVEHGDERAGVHAGLLDDGFFVEDDGPGIPPDEREAVFEPGYSTRSDGTGFGLSIVRRIAEEHGWTVAATESAGGGARIEIAGVEWA